MASTYSSTIILGAGPAGLAMAGQLTCLGLPFTLLEASSHVGSTWRNQYDRLQLHTLKQYSALPHLPYPANYPKYVSRWQLISYLEQYADYFDIQALFNQNVRQISKWTNGLWRIQTSTDVFFAERVVVALGVNRIPNRPHLPGEHNFLEEISHSSNYRNGSQLAHKHVLIVGMGNSGNDIALDLLNHDARPVISVRGPVNIIRRDVLGIAAQSTAIWFNRLPKGLADCFSRILQQVSVGDLSALGLGKFPYAPSEAIRRGKIPVIDQGTLGQIKAGKIQVVKGIKQVHNRSVTFTDRRELPFDAIVLATGYQPHLVPILGNSLANQILTERGFPRSLWFDAPELAGLYFLGYALPLTGALYNLTADSASIAEHIAHYNVPPSVALRRQLTRNGKLN